ncbi:MAG: bifunctional phosphopantothenoylcysteine decarboxylase/phosphopantothenate--cysteine ligase CoaBC [Fibrobacteres bacterium]|nr:bifunctional phosphopantothenoylcysteine decarboxylase/phosphopantothenate--cysteine ligase CoaBC [Fibrobacterota bacterium]
MRLSGRHLLVGICGGIAAYKIPGFIRRLIKEGAAVQTVVTQNGARFVGSAALSTITKRPVVSDLFPENSSITTEHISASDWADALIIAPATANTISKCANGIADDFLSTLYLSLKTPVIFAPAMNTVMWDHEAVQHNIDILKKRGHTIIEPADGELACGTCGKGRLPEEDILLYETIRVLTPQTLKGKRVVITAGGTEEAIDPVRVITNRSSGKMGTALAIEAWLRGADVTLIHASMSSAIPSFIPSVAAKSAAAMKDALRSAFSSTDILIMAAAVSDFTPLKVATTKIKKSGAAPVIELTETADILKSLAPLKAKQKIVGFALEDTDAVARATEKMKTKGCDLLVLNGPSALGAETSEISILKPDGSVKALGMLSKEKSAAAIIDSI